MSKSKKNKVSINFSTVWDADYWMHSNDMYCGFNMPEALVSEDGKDEFAHGLPPYEKRKFYLADEYPAVPKNWVPSEGRKTSYFVPVKEGAGMWLDFNKNCSHKYEVAIVISVQGVNPITGMPCTSAGLEQYIDTCPKHEIKFGPHRYCEKCGYKWPKQNYLCTTGTPDGNLWLDGFRTASGVVRQYILTMDKIRGVAANIIKEDRVFAVGISFFLSKNPKPVIQQTIRSRSLGTTVQSWNGGGVLYSKGGGYKMSKSGGGTISASSLTKGVTYNCSNINVIDSTKSYSAPCADAGAESEVKSFANTENTYADDIRLSADRLCQISDSVIYNEPDFCSLVAPAASHGVLRSVAVKKVEIGAGANIDQKVHDDPEPLEFWRDEPESVICINYCLEEDAEKIIKAGKISLEGHKDSFLKDIPKGNTREEKATV